MFYLKALAGISCLFDPQKKVGERMAICREQHPGGCGESLAPFQTEFCSATLRQTPPQCQCHNHNGYGILALTVASVCQNQFWHNWQSVIKPLSALAKVILALWQSWCVSV
jgi:hypothetical protein